MMYGGEKSHSPIVPAKPPNEAEPGEAKEEVEGRGLAEGKTLKRNRFRTQSREILSSTLERIREAKYGCEHLLFSCFSYIDVMTRGKSRMRQFRTSGSVRGAAREDGSYRDKFKVQSQNRVQR